jgi:hypothetical protein
MMRVDWPLKSSSFCGVEYWQTTTTLQSVTFQNWIHFYLFLSKHTGHICIMKSYLFMAERICTFNQTQCKIFHYTSLTSNSTPTNFYVCEARMKISFPKSLPWYKTCAYYDNYVQPFMTFSICSTFFLLVNNSYTDIATHGFVAASRPETRRNKGWKEGRSPQHNVFLFIS